MSSEPTTIHDPEAILNAAAEQFNSGQPAAAPAAAPAVDPNAAPPSETPAPTPTEPTPAEMDALAQGLETSAPQSSPFEQKLLDELGGDPKLIAQRIINLSNSNAVLTRQLTEVMSRLEGATPSPEVAEPDVAEVPEVKFFSDQIVALEADVKTNTEQQSQLAARANEINAEVLRLQGERRAAVDDAERARIDSQIANFSNEYFRLNGDYQALSRENKSSARELSRLRFEQAQTASRVKDSIIQQREQAAIAAQEAQRYVQSTRSQFVNAVKAEAAEFGISDVTNLVPLLITRFSQYAEAQPPGTPAVDLGEFVKANMEHVARSFGLSRRQAYTAQAAQRVAAAPAATAQPTAPVAPQPVPRTNFDNLPLAEQVRLVKEHAARTLSGRGV